MNVRLISGSAFPSVFFCADFSAEGEALVADEIVRSCDRRADVGGLFAAEKLQVVFDWPSGQHYRAWVGPVLGCMATWVVSSMQRSFAEARPEPAHHEQRRETNDDERNG